MATTPARRKAGIGFAISAAAFGIMAGVMFTTDVTPPWVDVLFGVVDAVCVFLTITFTRPKTV